MGIVWAATKFRLDPTVGRAVPPGNTVKKLGAVGLVTATLNATAVVPAGRPGTVKVKLAPAPTLAMGAPVPTRVSNTRVGARPVNPEEAMGVTAAEGADAAEIPTALVAVTVNVYALPFVRPETVEPVPVVVVPPQAGHAGDGVIVYPVIAEPPSETGGDQATVAELSPAAAVTAVGAPGSVTNGAPRVTDTTASELLADNVLMLSSPS